MKSKLSTIFFIALLTIFIYLTTIVIWPYISYIIVGLLLAYIIRPLYMITNNVLKKPWLSSLIMVIIIFFTIFIPATMLTSSLAKQSYDALTNFDSKTLDTISIFLNQKIGLKIDLGLQLTTALDNLKNFLVGKTFNLISSIADFFIGMIIMFFVMFYTFKNGKELFQIFFNAIPLKESHKQVLVEEIQIVTNAVIIGQLLTSIIQGTLGGIGFLIFGIPNPVFWGFIMAILAFLPIVGTPIVFVPAGIIELINHNYVSGIGMLIYGFVLVTNIDNVIKPLIISERSQLNPALILIGVLGGLKTFGFIGFILGPLVIAILLVLIRVYNEDFKPSEEVEELKKKGQDFLIIPLKKRPKDKHRKVE